MSLKELHKNTALHFTRKAAFFELSIFNNEGFSLHCRQLFYFIQYEPTDFLFRFAPESIVTDIWFI